MTSPARWSAIRERVFKDQKGMCGHCWRTFNSHEDMHAHHAIYTRMKGLEKWLDSEHNIVLLCPRCHDQHGYLSSWYSRCELWSKKVTQGYDMEAWHAEIPMLIKDKFTWNEEESLDGK